MYTILSRQDNIEKLLQSSPSYRGIGNFYDIRDKQVRKVRSDNSNMLIYEELGQTQKIKIVGYHIWKNYQISSSEDGTIYLSQKPQEVKEAGISLPKIITIPEIDSILEKRYTNITALELLKSYFKPSTWQNNVMIGNREVNHKLLKEFPGLTGDTLNHIIEQVNERIKEHSKRFLPHLELGM